MSPPRSHAIGALLILASGCDLPIEARRDGPHVVRVTPDLTTGAVDRLVSIRIELDRRIAPGSVPQGVVAITSGENYVYVDLRIDVVNPALIATPYDALDPDVDYQLVLRALRDLDGHESSDTEPIVFHTGFDATPRTTTPLTYDDVAPTFASCVRCHGGAEPVLGLDLSSAEGVRRTAFGVLSSEVAPSVTGSLGIEVTAAFLGMPRISPHDPARSYLLYTMVGDIHIAGAPMPPDDAPATQEQLQQLQAWIRQGANGL